MKWSKPDPPSSCKKKRGNGQQTLTKTYKDVGQNREAYSENDQHVGSVIGETYRASNNYAQEETSSKFIRLCLRNNNAGIYTSTLSTNMQSIAVKYHRTENYLAVRLRRKYSLQNCRTDIQILINLIFKIINVRFQ